MPDLQLADEASRLVAYLRSADLSLITAESCTAGQISAELSAVAGSGKVMEGGFVVYSPAASLTRARLPAAGDRPAPRSGVAGTAGDSRVAGERAPRWC